MTKMIGQAGKAMLEQLHREVEAELTSLGFERQDKENIWVKKTTPYGRVVAKPETVCYFFDYYSRLLKPLVPFFFAEAEIERRKTKFWEKLIPGYRKSADKLFEEGVKHLRAEANEVRRSVWNALTDIPMTGISVVNDIWMDHDGTSWVKHLVYATEEEEALFNAGFFDEEGIDPVVRQEIEARCS